MSEDRRRGPYANQRKSYYKKAGPIKTACPVLRELFRRSDEKGYMNTQIADALNSNRSTVSNWRRGNALPDIWMYHEFADLLGVKLWAVEK